MFKRSYEMNARLPSNEVEAFVFNDQQAIGQIAVALPGATAIFRRHKLDFCCAGHVSLAQAISERNLNRDEVLQELNALQRPNDVKSFADVAALIDHILERYHAVHREQLPELIRMARRVEAVHREHPQVPTGLAALLEEAENDLLSHMMKEENILFPLLKLGGTPFVLQPIGVMRAEHSQHGIMLEQLMTTCHNAEPPQGACNTWRALYAGISQLQEDLINHIHLENNVLFQQFETNEKTQNKTTCCGSCG